MWSHDERKEISPAVAEAAAQICPRCKMPTKKYVKSHYTGGQPCVLLANYCQWCGGELERRN